MVASEMACSAQHPERRDAVRWVGVIGVFVRECAVTIEPRNNNQTRLTCPRLIHHLKSVDFGISIDSPGGPTVPHMVIFQTPDGNNGFNQFETLEESVSFVERLRNEQSIESARIFEMAERKFEFKPYYRVSMAMLETGQSGAGGAEATVDLSSAVSTENSDGADLKPPASVNGEAVSPPPSVTAPPAPPLVPPVAPSPSSAQPAPVGAASAGVNGSLSDSSPLIGDDANSPVAGGPSFMTPDAPADQPPRRGLFGR
jgi:hypothetical protein